MTDVPTMEQAMEQARRELEPEHEAQVRFRAKQLFNARRALARAREREAKLAEIHEHERAEIIRGAARAWRKLYGRKVASELRPDGHYWILRSQQRVWAFTDRDAIANAAGVLHAGALSFEIEGDRTGLERGRQLLDRDPGIEGVALTRHAEALDGADPPAESFETLASEVEARRMEERKRRAEEAAQRRREQRETQLYGTTLDGDWRE